MTAIADRWYSDPETAAILALPESNYGAELTAKNDALFAQVRALTANLCPECDGEGRVVGGISYQGNYFEPPEYEELVCPTCDGSGELVEPAGEPVVLPDADDWLMSYASRDYLPENGE